MARTIIRLPCLTRLLVRFDYCQPPADGDVPNARGKLISNARAPPHGRAADCRPTNGSRNRKHAPSIIAWQHEYRANKTSATASALKDLQVKTNYE